ncbi:MAG TPA: lysophospholipid acyltransferase family protein [Acidobacteriaceae bacterium]|nr:lysophospholipid acyltransferase family protein [Acidobacteriaceae bacterium]
MKDSATRLSLAQRLAIAILPRLASLLLLALHRTLRYEVIVEPGAEPATPPGLQIWCFWHRSLLPCACYFHGAFRPAVLISRSFDGELIARTIEHLGFRTVRGSSSRHGASGLLALAREVKRGYPAVFTADGPRGPLYQVKPGAIKLAQLTGYAIGSFYALPEKAWLLRSWDSFMIPKPFSRVAVSWGKQVHVPDTDDPVMLEAKRVEVEATLERVRRNAERHFQEKTSC